MKNLYILGACGSIGRQTLDIVRLYPESFKVIGMSVGSNIEIGVKLVKEFKPKIVCFKSNEYEFEFDGIKVYGDSGLVEVAKFNSFDEGILVNALVGSVGLIPTIESIKSKRDVALANKETLVMAGDIINDMLKEYNVKLFPIDSEHSAIWQCLIGEKKEEIKKIIITASGGSFRNKTREELADVSLKDALSHPNWNMGPKITIDSATMMNKGFEVIEAHHLFNIAYDKIETVLHSESIVHSFVEFNDSSVKAVLGSPDMHIPILYAMNYPSHVDYKTKSLDLITIGTLHFMELSKLRYPCLAYAYYAGEKGGIYPTILNASNEAAVKLFLTNKISFLDIETIVYEYINKKYNVAFTIDNIIKINEEIQNEILEKYGVE